MAYMMSTPIRVLVLMVIIGGIIWYLVGSRPVEVIQQNSQAAQTQGDNYSTLTANADAAGSPDAAGQTNQQTITNQQQSMSATLHTNKGDVTIEFSQATPNTVANFVKLAQAGFYNGTKFHRVIAGFMIQGGDPLSKDDSMMARWGTGGPGYQFADEIAATNSNDVGTIAMANAGPNTNGSQFFINVAPNNFLDTKHTVFGKVTAGLDVVMAISKVATGQNDRPVEPVVINSISVN